MAELGHQHRDILLGLHIFIDPHEKLVRPEIVL
jgi:hypothetical protein